MKAIIYTRVSSDEQVKGTSLDYQEKLCRKYCKDKGLQIIEPVFREEGASAKSTDRAEFLRAIEYCRKNKGDVHAFVVAKVDRFARNTEDHFLIRKRLLDYGVSLHSVSEPIGNSPVEKLMETILAGTADFDNAIRKQRCSDGMYARIKQGLYPWHPPIGYLCKNFKKQGLKKTEPDDPDPITFDIVQKGLREMSAGLYNKAGFARRLDELGLLKYRNKKTSGQYVDAMLTERRLKFYSGWLLDPREGGWIRGMHKPMITDEDVHKILAHLSGKKRTEAHNRYNPMYPLRGLVLCTECGRKLTASPSTSKNGESHPYYHCYYKQCSLKGKTIKKDELEKAFAEHLAKVTPNEEWLAMLKATTIDLWKEQGASFEKDIDLYERKLKMFEEKRKRIFDMREDGSYNNEEFQERKAEVENDIMTTKISLSEARIEQFDVETAVIYATDFIKDLSRQWVDLPPKLYPKFQNLIFPAGFTYHKDVGVRTPQLGYIYELNQRNRNKKTNLVDRVGFEPTTN